MTAVNMAALFGAMAVLAAVPSVSVAVVSARAASAGFVHGAFAAMGVVAGDVLFILLAMFGLALLVEAVSGMFFLVKYLGGAYLVWLGIGLWRSSRKPVDVGRAAGSSPWSSFASGLLVTLGDQKAALFYLGFLPAFVDPSSVSGLDAGVIVAIAVVSVGGVKLGYAYAADRGSAAFGPVAGRRLSAVAACVMVASGVLVMVGA